MSDEHWLKWLLRLAQCHCHQWHNANVFFYLHKTTNDVLLPAINHGLVDYHIQGLFKWSQPKIIASLWSPLYFSEWFKIFYFNLQKKSMFWVQIHNPTTHNLSLLGFLTNPSNSVYPKLISSPCSGNYQLAQAGVLRISTHTVISLIYSSLHIQPMKILHSNIQKTKIMASGPITSWQIDGEIVTDFILGGSKITADGDCSHEIKRHLLLKRKVMTNLDSIFKSRDITLSTKVHLVKAMVFPVVMYEYESWTIKKAEHQRIDAFELWCWRRLLKVPWTARRSN